MLDIAFTDLSWPVAWLYIRWTVIKKGGRCFWSYFDYQFRDNKMQVSIFNSLEVDRKPPALEFTQQKTPSQHQFHIH
ncbi:hypothetical protein BCT84_12250 [Vibrio breoganii]|nr:hypothetical protein BCT84_12250 [Vibrio breoganii]